MYLYTTHGLLQTAIDMPVLDALRGGIDISSEGELDQDDVDELQEWLEDGDVLARIGDAFIWARLFGGGALVINTESDTESPLGDEIKDGKIDLYDACRWELTCDRRIPSSGHYGYYGKTLDASRVITILGKRAPWTRRAQLSDWGMSELERAIEDFNMFLRTRNVIYAILEEAKVDVFALKGFNGQLASSTGTAITSKRIALMNQIKNFQNALIMDSEDKYETKQLTFSGLAEIMKENRMGLASAFRMPMSKLFGIPAAGLTSGEDDFENYNGLVESEVREPMKHVIKKVLKLGVRHLWGEDFKVDFKFRPLRTMSALDEEQVKSSKANRYNALYSLSLMTSEELGKAYKTEELSAVPLKAEKGLLDDFPATQEQETGDTDKTPPQGTGESKTEAQPAGAKLAEPSKKTAHMQPKKNQRMVPLV
jgi:phage-related protein (TIGR01555 family)